MLFACETADKCFVIQNDKTQFEIRTHGVIHVNSFAKIIQLLNDLDNEEKKLLSKVIRQEVIQSEDY